MSDLKAILSSKIFWVFVVIALVWGAFVPYYFMSSVDYQKNPELQIVGRGPSYIRLHPKHSPDKDIVVIYCDDGSLVVKVIVKDVVIDEYILNSKKN